MLKRLLACSFILVVFPLLTSSVHHSNNPAPFASAVFAGHINTGGRAGAYCECGCLDCICDPGESQTDCQHPSRLAPSDNDAVDHVTAPTGKAGRSGLDVGSSALMLAAALWLWARMRT